MNSQPRVEERISGPFRIGKWSIDPALDEIASGGEVIKLEPRMMRLLCRLASTHGQVVSSRHLLDTVWPGVVVGPTSVYQAISALRKTLGDTGATPTYIATVARKGYRLIAPVALPAPTNELPLRAPPAVVPRRFRSSRHLVVAAASVLAGLAVVVALWSSRQPAVPQAPVARPAAVAWPSANLPSIAILPFRSNARDEVLAATLTDVLHTRLITQPGMLIMHWHSAGKLADTVDTSEIGKRLHARYLLRGDAARENDLLHVNVALVDSTSGATIWARRYLRAAREVTALREDVVSNVGTALHVALVPVGNVPIDLAAYELYMRGLKEYLKLNKEGFESARGIFSRATALYPEFARGYFGLAIAIHQMPYYLDYPDAASEARDVALVHKALDRAIELDPNFGEAIIDRAEETDDPVDAENLFRHGIALVPSYEIGAFKYGLFLLNEGRIGEGLAALDHGLRVAPRSSVLRLTKAATLLGNRGDVVGAEAILRDLLMDDPDEHMALSSLGWMRYAWGGQTAEGIRTLERSIASDPAWPFSRRYAAIAYLDADDPDAAVSAANGMPLVQLDIAQYRRTPHPIAVLDVDPFSLHWQSWDLAMGNPVGEALRDEALATGSYSVAISVFRKIHEENKGPPLDTLTMDLPYAHTLILSGDVERGQRLAKEILRTTDAEQAGRPAHWFARARSYAHALLGDDDRAMAELAESMRHGEYVRWWYTAELDPVYAHLRTDPRFQALAENARRHRQEQRASLDDMRRKGEVPARRT